MKLNKRITAVALCCLLFVTASQTAFGSGYIGAGSRSGETSAASGYMGVGSRSAETSANSQVLGSDNLTTSTSFFDTIYGWFIS